MAMEARDVLDVLTILREAQVDRVWLDGGWGIDALLGAQHRDHDDLDLVVPVDDVDRIVEALERRRLHHLRGRATDSGRAGRPRRSDRRPPPGAHRRGRHRLAVRAPAPTAPTPSTRPAASPRGGSAARRSTASGPRSRSSTTSATSRRRCDREDIVRLCERFTIPLPDEYK